MNQADSPMIWALIPARGGSKRVAGKNLKPLAGKSLVARTVATSVRSGCFGRVIVSTDDMDIAEEARRAGAEVPFQRPAVLSDDSASSLSVLMHFCEFFHKNDPDFACVETICLLQPTSPMLRVEHLVEAIKVFKDGHFSSLSSMKKVVDPPEWMFNLSGSAGRVVPESLSDFHRSRFELSERYIENGAIYLISKELLLERRGMYDLENHGMYGMSAEDSVDIDTPSDWRYAEFLLKSQDS